MDEDDFEDTQWTEKAKRAYQRSVNDLIDALHAHVTATLSRTGQQKELAAYFDSADTLMSAVQAFNEAEGDWCGSFPLALRAVDEDGDADADEDWDEEGETAQGAIVSVVGRWDFRIIDEAAVLAAGRAAYLRAWPDETNDDAEVRVQDVQGAAAELMHADGMSGVRKADGLQLERDAAVFVVHDAEDEESFRSDPFSIGRD